MLPIFYAGPPLTELWLLEIVGKRNRGIIRVSCPRTFATDKFQSFSKPNNSFPCNVAPEVTAIAQKNRMVIGKRIIQHKV